MKKKTLFLLLLSAYLSIFLVSLTVRLSREPRTAHRFYKLARRSLYKPRLYVKRGKLQTPTLKKIHSLKNVPLADDVGIVVNVQNIEIPNTPFPYNPSLVKHNNSTLLFFRTDDQIEMRGNKFHSYINYIPLDENFTPKGSSIQLNSSSSFSEDPRAFAIGKDLYVTYNDLASSSHKARTIKVAKVDLKKSALKGIVDLDLHLKSVEKNWTPFLTANNKLFFSYTINPHNVLSYNLKSKSLNFVQPPHSNPRQQLPWKRQWGELRGGTPAQLVDGRYLGFFHSAFFHIKTGAWIYLMGAYTFKSTAPYDITHISRHPILFKDIYDSPIGTTADKKKKVIFPSGFIVDGDRIQVACGINDSAIKIVTFDKERLFESLAPTSKTP